MSDSESSAPNTTEEQTQENEQQEEKEQTTKTAKATSATKRPFSETEPNETEDSQKKEEEEEEEEEEKKDSKKTSEEAPTKRARSEPSSETKEPQQGGASSQSADQQQQPYAYSQDGAQPSYDHSAYAASYGAYSGYGGYAGDASAAYAAPPPMDGHQASSPYGDPQHQVTASTASHSLMATPSHQVDSSSSAEDSGPLPESLSPDPPSKVLHFRNVTAEITQTDIMDLATPFGAVDKIVMMRAKNQCLLEFKSLANAINMINFYINTTPQIRGRKVYMKFSRHTQLTASGSGVNRILLVTLQTDHAPTIPITADVVWQIFSPYGFIEKIVVINKSPTHDLQALIQYTSPMSGSAANQYLSGKTVYVGTDPILSITLYIQYSHLQQLTVKNNSATARDYLQPVSWNTPQYGYNQQQGYGGYQAPYGGGGGYMPQHYDRSH
ncbi:Polypyrimidine tract-binding protein 3 [Balamuthia mandrillaris]